MYDEKVIRENVKLNASHIKPEKKLNHTVKMEQI